MGLQKGKIETVRRQRRVNSVSYIILFLLRDTGLSSVSEITDFINSPLFYSHPLSDSDEATEASGFRLQKLRVFNSTSDNVRTKHALELTASHCLESAVVRVCTAVSRECRGACVYCTV